MRGIRKSSATAFRGKNFVTSSLLFSRYFVTSSPSDKSRDLLVYTRSSFSQVTVMECNTTACTGCDYEDFGHLFRLSRLTLRDHASSRQPLTSLPAMLESKTIDMTFIMTILESLFSQHRLTVYTAVFIFSSPRFIIPSFNTAAYGIQFTALYRASL